MQLHTFYFNPFRECTYLLSDDLGQTIIFDCGCYTQAEKSRLTKYVEENNLKVNYHLLTHAHIDHVLGAKYIFDKYDVIPILSNKDAQLFNMLNAQAQAFGLPLVEPLIDQYTILEDLLDNNANSIQKRINLPDFNSPVYAIQTPGHSLGSVCYYLPKVDMLFSGDTLFQSGYGRTDLPGGDYIALMDSLKLLSSLPANTNVLPGHGYSTTIGNENE